MANLLRTIIGNAVLRLAQQYHVLAGVDSSLNPRLVKVGTDGRLDVTTGGFAIPANDYSAVAYVGSTNNIDTVTYKIGGSGGTTVAVITVTYVGGTPATDNAKIASIHLTTP